MISDERYRALTGSGVVRESVAKPVIAWSDRDVPSLLLLWVEKSAVSLGVLSGNTESLSSVKTAGNPQRTSVASW